MWRQHLFGNTRGQLFFLFSFCKINCQRSFTLVFFVFFLFYGILTFLYCTKDIFEFCLSLAKAVQFPHLCRILYCSEKWAHSVRMWHQEAKQKPFKVQRINVGISLCVVFTHIQTYQRCCVSLSHLISTFCLVIELHDYHRIFLYLHTFEVDFITGCFSSLATL